MLNHETWMRRAIEAATRNPECPFGAVLVDSRTTEVVAEGVNRAAENPTWHGEIDCINRFSTLGNRERWPHLHLYTTAEPCCMCQGAIMWAGIPVVVYGTSIERLEQLGWKQIAIGAAEIIRKAPFGECQLIGGVLVDECDGLFAAATKRVNG